MPVKYTQLQALYSKGSTQDRCATCVHYLGGGMDGCQIVQGPIAPDMWCRFFVTQPEIITKDGGNSNKGGKEPTMEGLQLFIPLTKVDQANRLVYGVATAEVPDRSGEIFDYASSKEHYQKWSEAIQKASGGLSLGNVREMHQPVAVGKLTQLEFNDEAKRIEVCAKVVDDNAWNMVLEGVYTGFSQGGSYVRKWTDPNNPSLKRYTANPTEISLVDLPCVPEATFEILKADGSTEMRKFTAKQEPEAGSSNQVQTEEQKVETKARELCKAAGKDPEGVLAKNGDVTVLNWWGFVEDAKAALTKSAEDPSPQSEQPPSGDEVVQGWRAKDGTFFAKKADAIKHNAELEAQASVANVGKDLQSALTDATAALEKRNTPAQAAQGLAKTDEEVFGAVIYTLAQEQITPEDSSRLMKIATEAVMQKAELNKRDFTNDQRKKLAKEGKAMPDGSFPIENEEDLHNAIRLAGNAKNPAAAKKHIVKRAKEMGLTGALPADFTEDKSGDDKNGKKVKKGYTRTALEPLAKGMTKEVATGTLRKGLYQVSRAAYILSELNSLMVDVKFEEEIENDGSPLPNQLKGAMQIMCQFLQDLVVEECEELMENYQDLDVEVLEMAVGIKAGGLKKYLGLLGDEHPLIKGLSEVMKKGTYSKKVNIQAAHDHVAAAMDGDSEMKKANTKEHGQLQVAHDILSSMGATCMPMSDDDGGDDGAAAEKLAKSALFKAETENKALRKLINDLTPQVQELAKRVKELEDQPMPAKGVTGPVATIAVSKKQDNGGLGGQEPQLAKGVDGVLQALGNLSNEERAMVLMKAALSSPVPAIQR